MINNYNPILKQNRNIKYIPNSCDVVSKVKVGTVLFKIRVCAIKQVVRSVWRRLKGIKEKKYKLGSNFW